MASPDRANWLSLSGLFGIDVVPFPQPRSITVAEGGKGQGAEDFDDQLSVAAQFFEIRKQLGDVGHHLFLAAYKPIVAQLEISVCSGDPPAGASAGTVASPVPVFGRKRDFTLSISLDSYVTSISR